MSVDRALPAAHDPRSRFSLAVAIVGLAGVARIFLPFAYDVSPFSAAGTLFSRGQLFGDLWHWGLPAMLAILVTAGTFLWARSGRLTRAELVVGYLAALVAAACLLSIFFDFGSDDARSSPSGFIEWFMLAFPWVGSAAGVAVIWRNTWAGVPAAANVIAAMQIVYVIVAVDCLVTWASEGKIGAYLVAVTTLAYIVQVVAIAVAAPGRTALAPK
jgi:hypothetical protein